MTLRAAVYCRVSTPGQAEEGYSLEGQVTECLALAEWIGATVANDLIFKEVGSGADWDLPQLLELLDRAQRGEFDVVITLATSRLARDVGKLAVLQRTLKRAGVAVHYVHHRFDDSPTGQLTETMLAAIDVYERQNAALRFALGKRAKLARGLPLIVGPTPYGYVTTRNDRGRAMGLELDPETSPIVKRIFHDIARQSLPELCASLDADGITPPGNARQWGQGTIRFILRNPAYIGQHAYGRRRWTVTTGADGRRHEVSAPRDAADVQYVPCPPIVTPAEQTRALDALNERRSRHGPRIYSAENHPYALRSLLSCGVCDGPLSVVNNCGVRYYECGHHRPSRARLLGRQVCTLPAVPAVPLEAEAWRVVRSALLNSKHLRTGLDQARNASKAAERRQKEAVKIRAEIQKTQKALEKQVLELLTAESGSAAERALRTVGHDLEARMRRLHASLEEIESQPAPGLSDEDVIAVEQFARGVQDGIAAAEAPDQHAIYRLLQLRGTVVEDPEKGIQMNRKRFSIEWSAVIELRDNPQRLLTHCQTLPARSSTPSGVAPAGNEPRAR